MNSRPEAAVTTTTPVRLGQITLANRLALAPMTRRRADTDGQPTPRMAEYYAQRGSFGLVIVEGTYPSVEGRAYPFQPGVLDHHTAGWVPVTEAVHRQGAKIVLQLMHAGRVTHPDTTGVPTVLAPSAVDPQAGHAHNAKPNRLPQAATTADIDQLIDDHATAAKRAIEAGFDGVELHSANGYLLQQFLAPNTNQRTDRYGGSPANRARFVIEVVEAVSAAIGADRVGIRLSPGANIQGIEENDPEDLLATYTALARAVQPLGLAYVSVIHPDICGALVQRLRRAFGAPLVANTGFVAVTDHEEARHIIESGAADVVAVGRAAIANPDLPARWQTGAEEALPDQATFYSGGDRGYIDYPPLSGSVVQRS
ncbi:alkene reductase [Lentzea sp. HUAS12]|uniref:alkene reductase n=1 Tax=Lentzea sp. HUAS12 TaxID=2951806 RepID=UPI0020A11B62|nr:alkene reductase [Lentzea sp. HUAS12]USX48988.1 alkene reductase [Lentzea sp. HUAS12]